VRIGSSDYFSGESKELPSSPHVLSNMQVRYSILSLSPVKFSEVKELRCWIITRH
jgi:hypothetical protein